jgi:hypothetical protein
MDDEDRFHLTLIDKRNRSTQTFTDKAYSIVIGKAFSYMLKEIKTKDKEQF